MTIIAEEKHNLMWNLHFCLGDNLAQMIKPMTVRGEMQNDIEF
jgi:hypothetical protein